MTETTEEKQLDEERLPEEPGEQGNVTETPAETGEIDGEGVETPTSVAARPVKKSRKKLIAVIVAIVLVLCVGGGVFAAFATGVISPAGAAAKYGLFDYVTEEETTDYIETYKSQMGYGDADDSTWASFLAAYNMTPQRLRASTIDQLVTDKIVQQKCDELGITVEDSELDQAITYYKNLYGSGSDSIWQETLSQFGQTEEGFRESTRLSMLKQKLAENQVEEPTPTDDQVKSTVASYIDNANSNETSLLLKHSYCFKKSKSSSEGSLEEREEVQKIRDGLVEVGASQESFASIVSLYSDDDSLKETAGANGWNADTSGYSDEYVKALASVGKGGVSSVYSDDECYFFVWVSDTYKLPKKSSKATSLDLSQMPDALHQYFSDVAAYSLWQTEAQEYLTNITSDVNIIYYDMPSDVPYNVDMSLAQTSSTDSEESSDDSSSSTDTSTSESGTSADADGEDSSSSSDAGSNNK